VSDYRLPVFTREFAVYVGVGSLGLAALALPLADNALQFVTLFIGVLYGWFLTWFRRLARARFEARRGESSREEVSP